MWSKVYSVGHSVKSMDDFIWLIENYNINVIVDVRSFPYSKIVPWFNREKLEASLKSRKILYGFMGDVLGGRWDEYLSEGGIVDYTKVMEDERFVNGIKRILNGIKQGYIVCLMCSEADPRKCHRSMLIGRYLLSRYNVDVKHILDESNLLLQSQIVDEILKKYSKGGCDLFMSNEDILNYAYNLEAKKVAYKAEKKR